MDRSWGTRICAGAGLALLALAPAAQAGTERASVNSNEEQTVEDEFGAGSSRSIISGNGRFVVFESTAPNLVPGDTNNSRDIFVRDLQLGTTERVSVTDGEVEASGPSFLPDISADGRYVVFQSAAGNLDAGEDNVTDIYLRDRQNGSTEQISFPPDIFAQGSFQPSVSDDGRFVAYDTTDGDSGDFDSDVYVHDRTTDATEQIGAGNGSSDDANLSADGTYVAFSSISSNLVAGDTGSDHDVFVADRNDFADTDDETIERASLKDDDAEPVGFGSNLPSPSVSADGRFVAFASRYTELFPEDDESTSSVEVAVRDLLNDTTERIDVSSDGTPSDNSDMFAEAAEVDMSADARFVVFTARSTNLVPGDAPGTEDVFLRDRQATTTTRFSVSSEGEAANNNAYNPSVSDDGSAVAFDSEATNLVPNDTNARPDVFVRTPDAPPDTDPPETTIEGPKRTQKRKPSFELSADEPNSTFECSLDGKPFAPCGAIYKPPKKLKLGKHTLLARATDPFDNQDPTPAEHRFKVVR